MKIASLLLPRQDNSTCIDASTCPPLKPCNCTPEEECILLNRDCNTCGQTACVPAPTNNNTSEGVSKGALAGGIVGAVVFLALTVSLYFWYRHKLRLRKHSAQSRIAQKDRPAPAEDVLNRPDPIEKLPAHLSQQSTTRVTPGPVDLESHGTSLFPPPRPHLINPFDDSNSIQTTKTEGPNVIPIALVSPGSTGSRSDTDTLLSTNSLGPVRPPRSPDLNLNLDHVNVSNDNIRPPYAGSTISGVSAMSRNSYLSGASYSSDFLNEAPVIVTANKGAVRQVLNVVKAEVVTTGTILPVPDGSLKPPPFASRPAVTSPLASTSFGPNDVLRETDENEGPDPFEDNHSTTAQGSTSPMANNFAQTSSRPESINSKWVPDGPTLPWARSDDSRPSSISTQAGSIVNIGSATRVNVGLSSLGSPTTPSTVSRTPYRTTMGRLISPMSGGSLQPGTMQEQQARAYAHAQGGKRISGSSVVSATSTRADSILEAFPFVPPSPISDRPVRSPPVSPLTKQSFTSPAISPPARSPVQSSAQPSTQPVVTIAPASPLNQQDFNATSIPFDFTGSETLPAPPNRRTLGMSTGSQLSTTSTGLGQFPFHIETGSTSDTNSNSRPNTLNVRQRASLDTLALTSDLASYPLDFERDSIPPPPPSRLPREMS